MSFINNYKNLDFTLHYAEEVQENNLPFIYSVGYTKNGPCVIKTRKSGSTVWQKQLTIEYKELQFYKLIQLKTGKGNRYVISAYDGHKIMLISIDQSGNLGWAKHIETVDEDIHCFIEPVPDKNEFYVAYSDKNNRDLTKNPIVLKMDEFGNITGQVLLESTVQNTGFVINAAKSYDSGLVLTGRLIQKDSVGIIIDLSENLKKYAAKIIPKPFVTFHDVVVNKPNDYTLTGYSNSDNGVFISRITVKNSAPYSLFPKTANHGSTLALGVKNYYVSIHTKSNATIHSLNTDLLGIYWSKQLVDQGDQLALRGIEFQKKSNSLTLASRTELVHTNADLDSCITKMLDPAQVIPREFVLQDTKLNLVKSAVNMKVVVGRIQNIHSAIQVICANDTPCVKDEKLCELLAQLQALIRNCFSKFDAQNPQSTVDCAQQLLNLIQQFDRANPQYNLNAALSNEFNTIKTFIKKSTQENYNESNSAFETILAYLYELGNCACGEEEFNLSENAMLQSPHFYLQSTGSLGNDSTKGMHLRWLLKGALSKHLPKANYAIPGINFNKVDDFVKIYRSPYIELKTVLDLSLVPGLVSDAQSTWAYTVGTNVFYVYFRNAIRYAQVRTTFNPATDPVGFIKNYGNEIVEIEHKTKTSFAVTVYFAAINSTNSIQFELLSTEDSTITAPKRTTLRKTHTLTSLSGIKQFSENIRSIRLRANQAFITKLEFEFYADFIGKTTQNNAWNYIGKHALTKDTTLAYNRLEPQPGSVHGKWLRFNDDAYVNVDNYKTKWNSPLLDPENRILDTVDQYITLSNTVTNPTATELIYFNDPAAVPIPGYEPDADFDPSENQFELSNLYILQLASMDYHVARMLGLGVLDLSPTVFTGKYIYLAEYVSFGDLEDGSGAREVQHIYCSLPTELSDERLPIPIDLKAPVPGIFQGLGTEAPSPLTDANGYSIDGKTRFLSLFNEDLPDEPENGAFYQSNFEFISANATIPVFAGIEYRSSTMANWQKPELPFDRDYFNIDLTVAPDQTNETRVIVLPDPGYPVFVHREKQNGWHDYSSYGINWFSRATASPVIHTIETVIAPTNLLQPPTNINAVLIRKESPLLLTSVTEQLAFNAITTTDKTFIRLAFDYNHGQELIDYHKEINGELISGYFELPDSEELFAEDIEIFFRNEIPNAVSGKIDSVIDDANPLLAIITTDEYVLLSQGADPNNTITPDIPSGLEPNFVGSALTVNGETYIIHQVDNSGAFPKFTVFKNDANGFPVALSSSAAPGDLTVPTAGELFIVIENMLSTTSWNAPNPFAFKVNVDLDTIYNETIDVHIPDGTIETHVQKFRGLYENALVEKILEDHDGDEVDGIDLTDTPRIHQGLYKLTFSGVNLPQHSQAVGSPHSVEWSKGVVRLHTDALSNGPRKALQVIKTENIGSTMNDLIVYAADGSFDASDPTYDQVSIGVQLVNYYPGYKVYFKEDTVYGLTESNILPGPDEDIRYSIFGLRSHDTDLNFVSKISQPVLMFAQKIEEPLAPQVPLGGKYATRPDFFGKASYTFTTQFDHKPHAVQFGRASDVQILTAFWRNDQPTDPLIWTVKRIQEEIFDGGNAPWYVERWNNLLGFDYVYPSDPANDGNFEILPNDPLGTNLPLPNNPKFIDAINAFIGMHNSDFGTSILPISAITSLHQIIIPVSGVNAELRVVDFLRDVVHNCFVPLTEIPLIFQYIKDNSYTPIPKKQVTRDERGDLLQPTDPDFDMAPMMKVIATNQTQFTDFGIDGAANTKYFYISREFNLQMKTGPYSPVLGPINLVNTLPPRAPEIIKITPILENRAFNIAPAIELQLNAYASHQHIQKITIYRATSMQDALSVRTMKQLPEIDITTADITGEVWKVRDDFSDLGYVPFGDPLFYVITVSREVKYNDRDQMPVTEYQPSEPSKLTMTNIVENYNPESPVLSFTSDPLNPQNELESVVLSWNKTVYNGKYHLYKRNASGNWIKIGQVIDNANTLTIALADTDLASGTLPKTNADGNTIYHAFKVVAENFAGMLSRDEKIQSI